MAEGIDKTTSSDFAATFTDEKLQEIVRRIVEVADPVKIVLFGSAASGEMNRHSDADFLVIVEPPVSHHRLTGDIYGKMTGIGVPMDILVFTTEEVDEHRKKPYYVIHPALNEGKVVYERQAA